MASKNLYMFGSKGNPINFGIRIRQLTSKWMLKLQNQTHTLELNMPHKIRYLKNFCAVTGTEFCTLLSISIVTHFIWQEDKPNNRRIMVFVLAIELHTWLAKTKQWVKENILITPLTFPKLKKFHSYY